MAMRVTDSARPSGITDFQDVWLPEACVLQWLECSLENFENTPKEYMNLVMRVWLKFI